MKLIDKKGFTLIELLVVIAIIGILVTMVIIAINPIKLIRDSQDTKARSNMQQIKASLQLYYNDCKDYPPTDFIEGQVGGQWDGNDDAAAFTCSAATTIYMRQVPTVTGLNYIRIDASNYRIEADLFTTTANRSADDTATLTKCGAVTNNNAIDYAVCND